MASVTTAWVFSQDLGLFLKNKVINWAYLSCNFDQQIKARITILFLKIVGFCLVYLNPFFQWFQQQSGESHQLGILIM